MEKLTPKELETIPLIAHGEPNKGIARIMCLSEQTVSNRVSVILRKLKARNRAHVVYLAALKGIISINTLILAMVINASDVDMRRGARRPSRRRMIAHTSYTMKIVDPYYIPDRKSQAYYS